MFNEISDSLKVKLYDYAYTPFFSSFLISWIVLNHKYLMIYFSNETNEKKLYLLSKYGKVPINEISIYDPILPMINILEIGSHFFWYPLAFALFYVYGYPYISNWFYAQTRKMNNKKKAIKLMQDNKEPIDEEEKRTILLENHELNKEIKKLKLELSQQEKLFKEECDDRVDSELSINQDKINKLEINTRELIQERKTNKELIQANEKLGKEIEILRDELKISKEEAVAGNAIKSDKNISIPQIIEEFKLDQIEYNILQIIYQNNIGTEHYDNLVNKIIKHTTLKKIKIETALDSLIKKNIIIKDNIKNCNIDEKFKKNMVLLFDE